MPVFMIERRYADLMQPTPDEAAAINAINAEEDVRWLTSFLSSDQLKAGWVERTQRAGRGGRSQVGIRTAYAAAVGSA